MSQQVSKTQTPFQTKTYVRGSFLFSTDDGSGYQQKNRNRAQDQIQIQDKANVGSLKRQIQSRKQELIKKKQKSKKQKQMLIPIRDTPVQPLPQPMMDNNKCERATQQQFQYFQTYISLKQKQRKFQQDQQGRIQAFQRQQELFRKAQVTDQTKVISIVMQKDTADIAGAKPALKKKGPFIKVIIKKKQTLPTQNKQQTPKSQLLAKEQSGINNQTTQIKGNQDDKNQFEQDQIPKKVRVIEDQQQQNQ